MFETLKRLLSKDLQHRWGEKTETTRFKTQAYEINPGAAMTISINLPKEVMSRLQSSWGNLPRRALEALAVEAYREEVLSSAEVGSLLGHNSRTETEAFLHARQAYLHYTAEDLAADMRTMNDVSNK